MSGARSMLIVDDSRTVRAAARRFLTELGFQVAEAEDGAVAAIACSREMPAGILLDWNMPNVDGLTFLKQLRAMPGGEAPRVVFCTTEADLTKVAMALETGADEYIMKPFDLTILSDKLTAIGLL